MGIILRGLALMRLRSRAVCAGFLTLCAIALPLQLVAAADVELNAAERAWLASHPTIRYAPDPTFPPFEFFDDNGNYKGIAADYLAIVEQKLGIKFELVRLPNWDVVLEYARQRKIDLLPAAARSRQRAEYLAFTEPHIRVSAAILTASNRTYSKLDDLAGKTVVVVSGYVWEDVITNRYPRIRVAKAPDIPTALKMTSLGVVDAMVTDMATTGYYIKKEGITNLRVSGAPERALELTMASRKDWPELNSILDKTLDSISDAEREVIQQRWIRLERPSLLRNTTFWYVVLIVLSVIAVTISIIVMWNRALARQVQQRTQQLEDAQMKLIQAAKLESVGRLAAGVAHEVKNPLTIIQLAVDYLKDDQALSGPLQEIITDMDDAVRRADTVVRGLVDFSREQTLQREPENINTLIQETLKLVNHEFEQRNIAVRCDLGDPLPPVNIDKNKVQQVFINLLVNSAHAMEKDGALNITTRHVVSLTQRELQYDTLNSFRLGDDAVMVRIDDTGPGLHESALGKIFDPFFTTKPQGEGTGLGLSVTRNIIELHGGSIDIHNRKEGGVAVVLMFKVE